MIVTVDGLAAHAATGGAGLSGDEPVVLLVHGAGHDSSVWQLQTRYLAHHGVRAVAVDLPAHGHSEGEPLESIESMADWTARFIEAAGLGPVHVVGHSMGTFIALELASRYPGLVTGLVLAGTATGMPVHPELLDAAEHDLPRAGALMTAWGHAKQAHIGLHPTPGMWMLGGTQALVERSAPGVLATDFRACMAYANAEVAAAACACPATVLIGRGDKMTPAKSGRALAAVIPSATVVELADTGHTMMLENPTPVRRAILTAATG